MGSPWQIAMPSGWESEDLGFKIRRLQTTFDPGLLKKIMTNSQPKQCAFNEQKICKKWLILCRTNQNPIKILILTSRRNFLTKAKFCLKKEIVYRI